MASSDSPLLKNPYWRGVQKTKNYAIQGQDIKGAFHNLASTGNIVLTLPKAVPGLQYKFLVAASHTITVTPISTDTIRGRAMGATASNAVVGNLLSLVCIVPNFWEPEINIGSW